MKNLLLALTALVTMTASVAHADSLKPMQALSIDLGDRIAVVYYTEHNGAFEVVTTVGPDASGSQIVRHIATLNEGDDYTLSIAASDPSVPAQYVDITRMGNEISVATRLGNSSNAFTDASKGGHHF